MPCPMMLMAEVAMARLMRDRANRNLDALESHFAEGHQWLAGADFNVADFVMRFP